MDSRLRQAEYVRFSVTWLMEDPVRLPRLALLQLRRELRRAAARLIDSGEDRDRLLCLFAPGPSTDRPSALRWPKPPPQFVLRPLTDPVSIQPGDELLLHGTIWGDGIDSFPLFLRLLGQLGRFGIYCGEGRGEIIAIHCYQGDGTAVRVESATVDMLSFPRLSLDWFIQQQPLARQWELEWISPARLIVAGKPLFRPTFQQVVPLLLNRVVGMLACHCGIDLAPEHHSLDLLRQIKASGECRWQDWRTLDRENGRIGLGGIVGTWRFPAESVESFLWALQVGQLLNAGKGAAFGAGQYRMKPVAQV